MTTEIPTLDDAAKDRRIAELEAQLATALASNVKLELTQAPFITFDDGSKFYVDSWTGGAHDLGYFGGITLRFVAADGTATTRGYQALDTLGKSTATVEQFMIAAHYAQMFVDLQDIVRSCADLEARALHPRVQVQRVRTMLDGFLGEGYTKRVIGFKQALDAAAAGEGDKKNG
jgi:hypothetical protein